MLIEGKFNMQVNVPHLEYGNDNYFMPSILIEWLRRNGIVDYDYCGGGYTGYGYTNGVTNWESVYMVNDIQEEDATAFRIQFPKCKVYLFNQYDYSK